VAESVRVRGRSRAGEKKKGGTHGFSSCTRRFQLLPVDTVCTEDLRRLDRSQTDYIVSRGYVALATQRIILLHLPVILVSCSPNQCTYDRQTQTHDRDRCKSYLKIISWVIFFKELSFRDWQISFDFGIEIRSLVMENWKLI